MTKKEFYHESPEKAGFQPLTTKQTAYKQDLQTWPMDWFANDNGLVLAQRADSLALKSQNRWMPDQLLHHFGSWQVVLADKKIDAIRTAQLNLGSGTAAEQLFQLGCWKVACRLSRSKLLPKQIAQPEFSSLVPLILLGVQRYQDIPYSDWSRENLHAVMPQELADAMTYQPPELSTMEILDIRNQGLLVRSGLKEGTSRDPRTTWKLSGIADTKIGELNYLQQAQIAQIWIAHPEHRHKNQVLDPLNWDVQPEPLILPELQKVEPKWTANPWE